jgi:hypothetical protein
MQKDKNKGGGGGGKFLPKYLFRMGEVEMDFGPIYR